MLHASFRQVRGVCHAVYGRLYPHLLPGHRRLLLVRHARLLVERHLQDVRYVMFLMMLYRVRDIRFNTLTSLWSLENLTPI